MNHVQELVGLLRSGEILEAFDTYYSDIISMQENGEQPTVGFVQNRERELGFLGMIASVNEFTISEVVSQGSTSMVASVFDFNAKDGRRFRFDQVAVQHWENGKIVRERFVYDTAKLVAVGL